MKIRNFLITTISASFPILVFPNPALGQTAPQCTLEQISQALNQLDCTVSGAFVSPAALVQTITTACEPTTDEETCHACFERLGAKAGPALKALVKLKVLTRKSLSEFRIGIVTAEETTCAAKQPSDGQDDQDDQEDPGNFQPPNEHRSSTGEGPRGRGPGRGKGRGHGSGQSSSDSDASRSQRPRHNRGF